MEVEPALADGHDPVGAARDEVDLRVDVAIGGEWGTAPLIAASNRSDDSIDLYTLDTDERMLVRLSSRPTDIGEPYGLCAYRSPVDGVVYVLINDSSGALASMRSPSTSPASRPWSCAGR